MIQEHIELGPKTTMKVGGTARFFVSVETLDQLHQSLAFAKARQVPVFFLGGGSNVIISDDGFDGLVVQLANRRYSMDSARQQIIAGAAVPVEELVTQSTEKGWAGLEWAGGLPGTIGGAVRGNAGCFGGEIKNIISTVRAIDPLSGNVELYENADCQFAYRTSVFKTNSQIIWEVRLQLSTGKREELEAIRDANIHCRLTNHPQEPSVGSIFKNLYVKDLPDDFFDRYPQLKEKVRGEKIGARALLEELGVQGKRIGDAQVSGMHANFIVNVGQASSAQVSQLVAHMKAAVLAEFAIELEEEPQFVYNTEK